MVCTYSIYRLAPPAHHVIFVFEIQFLVALESERVQYVSLSSYLLFTILIARVSARVYTMIGSSSSMCKSSPAHHMSDRPLGLSSQRNGSNCGSSSSSDLSLYYSCERGSYLHPSIWAYVLRTRGA